jgi:hypothetical protein
MPRQLFGRLADGVMLGPAGEQPAGALLFALRQQGAAQRQVVGLGAAGGEDDLLRAAVQHACNGLTGGVDRRLGLLPVAMH